MNLLLLSPSQLNDSGHATITGRQVDHICNILKSKVGDQLKVGLEDGLTGSGTLTQLSRSQATLDVSLTTPPPPPLPITLLLALPRPKALKRIFQTVATLGIKHIYLINSYKVEKSYWQSPWLTENAIREQLILGLEQGADTTLPTVHLRKRFKPFVEDELSAIAANSRKLVAHPDGYIDCPTNISEQTTLAIGPEGGFTPYEIALLRQYDFTPVSLGPRILRVETAITALTARLFT